MPSYCPADGSFSGSTPRPRLRRLRFFLSDALGPKQADKSKQTTSSILPHATRGELCRPLPTSISPDVQPSAQCPDACPTPPPPGIGGPPPCCQPRCDRPRPAAQCGRGAQRGRQVMAGAASGSYPVAAGVKARHDRLPPPSVSGNNPAKKHEMLKLGSGPGVTGTDRPRGSRQVGDGDPCLPESSET